MKRLVLAATAAFIWAMPATAQSVNTAFIQMLNETGCDSRYNDDKKAFVFDRDYRNREMTVVGEFVNASSGSIFVKVLPSTLTFDVSIRLRNTEDAFDLEKGQRVTVKFQVSSHGGCILSYRGVLGVLVKQQVGR
jgi:hypothetical protein